MSKYITIQEGGVAKNATVDKLRTSEVGGGDVTWVPEDETELTTLYVSENGTYRASDEGYYGYSEVTVSGIGTVTGTSSTTGNEVVASVDEETGDLEVTETPSSIRINIPPAKRDYLDGETIRLDGAIVTAYMTDGVTPYDTEDYPDGQIPLEELIADPSTASYDSDKEGQYTYNGQLSKPQKLVQPVKYNVGALEIRLENPAVGSKGTEWVLTSDAEACVISGDNNNDHVNFLVFMSRNPFTVTKVKTDLDSGDETRYTYYETMIISTPGGEIVYAIGPGIISGTEHGMGAAVTEGIVTKSGVGIGYSINDAVIIYYDGSRVAGQQTIDIQWDRPGDYRTLSDSYSITVRGGN